MEVLNLIYILNLLGGRTQVPVKGNGGGVRSKNMVWLAKPTKAFKGGRQLKFDHRWTAWKLPGDLACVNQPKASAWRGY